MPLSRLDGPSALWAAVRVRAGAGNHGVPLCQLRHLPRTKNAVPGARSAAVGVGSDRASRTEILLIYRDAAADGIEVNGDFFASEEYRTHLISVLTGRALRAAAASL
jgi:hypothetical protein